MGVPKKNLGEIGTLEPILRAKNRPKMAQISPELKWAFLGQMFEVGSLFRGFRGWGVHFWGLFVNLVKF